MTSIYSVRSSAHAVPCVLALTAALPCILLLHWRLCCFGIAALLSCTSAGLASNHPWYGVYLPVLSTRPPQPTTLDYIHRSTPGQTWYVTCHITGARSHAGHHATLTGDPLQITAEAGTCAGHLQIASQIAGRHVATKVAGTGTGDGTGTLGVSGTGRTGISGHARRHLAGEDLHRCGLFVV
jgi:hypothetical protein